MEFHHEDFCPHYFVSAPTHYLPMRHTALFLLASFFLLPAALSAAEPSRGTVIMVSSIGGWVLFSSGSVVMREMRKARQKAESESAQQEQPKN